MKHFIILFLSIIYMGFAQTPKQSVLATTINGITSSSHGECGTASGTIDNRSQYLRMNDSNAVQASGTGSWTVSLQYSDTSCTGPWYSFGSQAIINNSSNPPVAYGWGYHPYLLVAVTGNAIVTYVGVQKFPTATNPGTVSFPIDFVGSINNKGFIDARDWPGNIQGAITAAASGELIFYAGTYTCSAPTWPTSPEMIVIQYGANMTGCTLPMEDGIHKILDQRDGYQQTELSNAGVGPVTSTVVSCPTDYCGPGSGIFENPQTGHLIVGYAEGTSAPYPHADYIYPATAVLNENISSDRGRTWAAQTNLGLPIPSGYGAEQPQFTVVSPTLVVASADVESTTPGSPSINPPVKVLTWDGTITPGTDTISWAAPVTAIATGSTFSTFVSTASSICILPNGNRMIPVYGYNGAGHDFAGVVISPLPFTSYGAFIPVAGSDVSAEQYTEAGCAVLPSGRAVIMFRHDVVSGGGALQYALSYSDSNGVSGSWVGPSDKIAVAEAEIGHPQLVVGAAGALVMKGKNGGPNNVANANIWQSVNYGSTFQFVTNVSANLTSDKDGGLATTDYGVLAGTLNWDSGGPPTGIYYQEFSQGYGLLGSSIYEQTGNFPLVNSNCLVVGPDYFGYTCPSTQSAIIENRVGIGTATPRVPLTVGCDLNTYWNPSAFSILGCGFIGAVNANGDTISIGTNGSVLVLDCYNYGTATAEDCTIGDPGAHAKLVNPVLPSGTTLPSSPSTGQLFLLTSSAGNACTAGGGGIGSVCYYNGSNWIPLGVGDHGLSTLSSGTYTVYDGEACVPGASCTYILTNCGVNGSSGIGTLSVDPGTVVAGTSFVINSLGPTASVLTTDNSKVCWQIK